MNTLILLASLIVIIYAVPIKKIDHISYLHKFGYLDKDAKVEDKDVVKAIKEFQVMASIKPTGFMNKESEQKMQLSRCGNHDKSAWTSLPRRERRYVLGDTKWNHTSLTYKITKYSKKISHAELDNSAAKAFKFWSDVTPLQFRQVYGDQHANIRIQFVYGKHDDNFPFDGPRGKLGHACLPNSGRVDMDEAERWTIRGSFGTINVMQVLTHEFGHALGLKHSSDTNSVMQPFYRGYLPNYNLGQDDIDGIQALYGRRTENIKTNPSKRITTTTKTTTTTTTTTISTTKLNKYQSPLCKDARFDAIAVISDDIMAFKGSKIYILNGDNPTKPRSIHRYYPGVPSNIDAVINKGKISTFIKGNKVYVFKYNSLLRGYPRPLHTLYPGLPRSISAAFTLDKYVYFVTRSGVYYKTAVSPGSGIMGGRVHRTRSPLRNAPSHVDTMFHSAEGTFAFTGTQFYMALKDRKIFTKVISTSQYWFNCS